MTSAHSNDGLLDDVELEQQRMPKGGDFFHSIIHQSFGHGPYHALTVNQTLAVDRLLADHPELLVRSDWLHWDGRDLSRRARWCRLMFRWADDLFLVVVEPSDFRVYAATRERAGSFCRQICEQYGVGQRRRRRPAEFRILTFRGNDVDTERVPLRPGRRMNDSLLAMHYGEDAPAWAQELIARMKANISGAIIFRGEPGTGKTSLVRHLIARLARTHHFYYIPVTHQHLLTNPTMVEFWARENRRPGGKRKVIVLEDAEPVLVPRSGDNHGALSNLLNISDGLLGEFLRVQILCTINCPIERLDPAVLRSGRLLAFREFRRLTRDEARRLAEHRGLSIRSQADYTLAEIYNPTDLTTGPQRERAVGFGIDSSSLAA
ncbi:MAG: ATP-binding protein [Verrucomicrobia bacterium]|nr:ATP-binding protein [Verrucomicrobiota bacterium]